MLLMGATAMLMSFLVTSAKTSVRQSIKGEGNFALSKIEYLIRNAESLTPDQNACTAGGSGTNTSLTLKLYDDPNTYVLKKGDSNNQLAYINQTLSSTEYLTSSNTTLSNLSFVCYGVTGGSRRIDTTFTLTQNVDTVQSSPSVVSETFRSVIQIRN